MGDIVVATAARPRSIHLDPDARRMSTRAKFQWPRRLSQLVQSANDMAASLREARFSELEKVPQDRVFRRSLKRLIDKRGKTGLYPFLISLSLKEVENGD